MENRKLNIIFLLLVMTTTSFHAYADNMADLLKAKEEQINQAVNNGWYVKKGQSLRDIIYEWAKRDSWNLVWHLDYDIKLGADAHFTGSLQDAIGTLLDSINQSGSNLNAQLYPENKVIVIKAGIDN